MLEVTDAFKNKVYAPAREITAKVHFRYNGKTYDDDYIIDMNILEEMSVYNESVPANELKLTMDNTQGDFDFLTLENMRDVIAERPQFDIELGLKLDDGTFEYVPMGTFYVIEWKNDISNMTITFTARDNFDMLSQISYRNSVGSYALGENVALGKTVSTSHSYSTYNGAPIGLLVDGDTATNPYVGLSANEPCYVEIDLGGIIPLNEVKVWHYWSDGRTYHNTKTEVSKDGVNWEVIFDSAVDGEYAETSAGKSHNFSTKGVRYIRDWTNGSTSNSGDHWVEIQAYAAEDSSLYWLAVDVLEKADITNYSIDKSIKNISISGFPERLDSREALQHIGVASQSAVNQNRQGAIIITPYDVLDKQSNFLTFTGQGNTLNRAISGLMTPTADAGYGMKKADFDNMFKEPHIRLDKSIYEVVVKLADGTEVVYINPNLNGKNGVSFKIENPLITDSTHAIDVAKWIIEQNEWNAIYQTEWRQNPILECGDVILAQDSFDAKKQSRIVKQEFEYKGYLRGITESRGGY